MIILLFLLLILIVLVTAKASMPFAYMSGGASLGRRQFYRSENLTSCLDFTSGIRGLVGVGRTC